MKQQNSLLIELVFGIEEEPPAPSQQYVLGYAEGELRRLVSQSRLIGDITEHVMQRAGIKGAA